MIKLTRGALTMLLAQYRGILKNAWIKNFAVAAALATTVTTAYADAAEVTTWDDAVKTGEGAVALDGTAGVLNIQESKEWQKEPSTIVITGGVGHKIGGKEGTDVVIFAEEKNKDNYPTGNITIDTSSRIVKKSGTAVELTLKEYELLLLFVKNKNIALYRETIYEQVWHEPYMGDTRTVDLHIQRLRKKLGIKDRIQSVYKVGYRYIEGENN